ELRDRLRRTADDSLLAGDAAQLVGAGVGDLRVRGRLAESHVDDDLFELGNRHHVLVAELLLESRSDFLLIPVFQAVHLSTTPSHLRQMRTLRPSPRILWPMRVTSPHSGQTSCTLLACSAASRSTIPPLMLRCGFGRVCRLIMLTPSTINRFLPGSTFSTRPRLPLSLPVLTDTVSFLRIGVWRRDIPFTLLCSVCSVRVQFQCSVQRSGVRCSVQVNLNTNPAPRTQKREPP